MSGGGLAAAVAAPAVAVRRTARSPALGRVQLSFTAVMVASWAATVSLSVVAYRTGGSSAVAIAVLGRTVPAVVLGPVLGAVVDRGRRSTTLAAAAAVSAAASAGAALAAGALVPVLVLVAVVALATTVSRAAQSAVLPELVGDPADLTASNVLTSAIEAIGVFAGPVLAGLLLAAQGPALAFGVAALLFAGAAVLAVGVPGAGTAPAAGPARRSRGLADVLRVPSARLLLALAFAQTLVGGALVVLYPAVAVDVLSSDVTLAGPLNAAFGLGGVVGSLGLFALAGSRSLGRLLVLALGLWSVPLLLVPVAPARGPVLVLLAVVGLGNVLFDVTVITLVQRTTPVPLLGRAFGTLYTVAVAGNAGGAALAALLDRTLGTAAALAGLGAALGVVGLAALPALRRLDRRLVAPVRQVALLRGVAPFALLPTVELEALALRLQRVAVAAGEAVVRQGELDDRWYVVDEGVLAVAVDGVEVGQLGAGEGFGEVALLREGIRTATVTARTRAVVWQLDGAVFLSSLRRDGGRALEAADAIARERLERAAPAA